jgi:hypothetical protein
MSVDNDTAVGRDWSLSLSFLSQKILMKVEVETGSI